MSISAARAVADAVLYEGYLLYPYRASAAKNRSRWQFGVLGPPAAAASAFAEPPSMTMQCLLTPGGHVTVHLRFLHLQVRDVERTTAGGGHRPVHSLKVDDETVLSWDEAVEHEVTVPPGVTDFPVVVPAWSEVTPLIPGAAPLTAPAAVPPKAEPAGVPPNAEPAGVPPNAEPARVPPNAEPAGVPGRAEPVGRIVRRRWPLTARIRLSWSSDGPLTRLTVTVVNEHPSPVLGKQSAARHSLLGAHLLLEAHDCTFVSVVDPPPFAAAAAARCVQDRCWPVLAGRSDLLLGVPIILYDNPQVAAESPGQLFDMTEIDEILTLRVLTMTDAEKAEARATDPRAAAVIDRCDALTPAELQRLHGGRRDPVDDVPSAGTPRSTGAPHDRHSSATIEIGGGPPRPGPQLDGVPWWDPEADASVDPLRDQVDVGGVAVGRDSLVVLRPTRRADAQDLFLAGRLARVTAVVSDVDGNTHVAVALADDPDADLHEWYGRYYYFAPDEIEPATEGRERS